MKQASADAVNNEDGGACVRKAVDGALPVAPQAQHNSIQNVPSAAPTAARSSQQKAPAQAKQFHGILRLQVRDCVGR